MAIIPLTKIRLMVHKTVERDVMKFLQKEGVVEITVSSTPEREMVDHAPAYARAELDFAIRFFSPYAKPTSGLRGLFLGDKIEVSPDEVSKILEHFDWEAVVKEGVSLEGQKNDMIRLQKENEDRILAVKGWEGLGVSVSPSGGRFQETFFRLPLQFSTIIEDELKQKSKYLEVLKLREDEKYAYFSLVGERVTVEESLPSLSAKKAQVLLYEGNGNFDEYYDGLLAEQKKLKDEHGIWEERMKELAKSLSELKVCYDASSSEEVLENTRMHSTRFSSVVVFEGWVRKDSFSLLRDRLSSAFGAVEIEEKIEEEKESPPVLLGVSKFLEPLLNVTKMYGTPKSSEIDPTPYLAPFYILFFGFCLTDAGYGLTLLVLTGLLLFPKLPLDKDLRSMLWLFFYGGISTVIMGVLFGGWFGLTTDQVPEYLTYLTDDGRRLFLGQFFDPMNELVTKVMPLAFILGGIHLALGIFLSGKTAWDNGDRSVMYTVSIPLLLMLFFAILVGVFPGQPIFLWLMLISVAVTMWGMGGSDTKNPMLRILLGVFALLNEALGLLSSLLSYSRLVALGLATGIIAMAFNIVASTIGGMLPMGINIIVMIIILLFGHILNIALNLLGAYVHSSRLQFVEFFGKFMEGGGREFTPLAEQTRYRFVFR